MPREQPKRLRRRTKGVPPLPIHLGSRFGEWFTARDVRGFAAIPGLPEMVGDPKQVATELDEAIDAAAAAGGVAAAMPKRDELMKWYDDVAQAGDDLLATLDLPPGLSGTPATYFPDLEVGMVAWLLRGASGENLVQLHGLMATSPLWPLYMGRRRPSADINQRNKQIGALASQALRLAPIHIGLVSELAREAQAQLHLDRPHGNTDVFRQQLFLRLRRAFVLAFGTPPRVMKDGERVKGPAVQWFIAVLKHAAERRQKITDDAAMTALDHLAALEWQTVATYIQKAASGIRKARKIGKL